MMDNWTAPRGSEQEKRAMETTGAEIAFYASQALNVIDRADEMAKIEQFDAIQKKHVVTLIEGIVNDSQNLIELIALECMVCLTLIYTIHGAMDYMDFQMDMIENEGADEADESISE